MLSPCSWVSIVGQEGENIDRGIVARVQVCLLLDG